MSHSCNKKKARYSKNFRLTQPTWFELLFKINFGFEMYGLRSGREFCVLVSWSCSSLMCCPWSHAHNMPILCADIFVELEQTSHNR